MAYDCSYAEERLQKKLIPVNIVVMVLCLVSIISLLFAPLVKIDAGGIKELVVEFMAQEDNSDSDGSYGSYGDYEFDDSHDNENAGSSSDSDMTQRILDEFINNIPDDFSFSTISLGQFAFSKENSIIQFIDAFFVKPGVIEAVLTPLVSEMVIEALDLDAENVDLNKLNESIQAFNNVNSEEEMRAAADNFLNTIATLLDTTIDPEGREEMLDFMADIYNTTAEVTGGEFDIEKFICVAFTSSEESGFETPVTSYDDLFMSFLLEDEEVAAELEAVDYAIKTLAKGVFATVMFSIAVWFILFVFVLVHLLVRNKRFTSWYVKLWGGIPCLIFWVVPRILGGLFATIGEELAVMSTVFGYITSFTWISGICYLLLWGVTLFWGWPIARKIKKEHNG